MTGSRIVGMAVWSWIALSAPALGFHEGGVARCDGCHVMHDGTVMPGPGGEGALLLESSPSDTCLICHAGSVGTVLGTDPLSPPPERGAGNFVFLFEDNLNDAVDGQADPIHGEAAGHSIVAPGRGLSADSRFAVAPGGTFLASRLACTSCHDPHGTESFRLLRGVGSVQGGVAFFSEPAPEAQGISLSGVESPTNHTAYLHGMSAWCGNCHGDYHDIGNSSFEHPGGHALEPDIRAQYNAYNGDASPIGGSFATAYLPEVPFEDPQPANTTSSTQGASGGSRVMCLSCHRAHASSAPAAGRWDFNVSLLAEDGLVSGSYPIPDPYDSPSQGTLCTKCHSAGPVPIPRPGRDQLLERSVRPPRITAPRQIAPR